MEKTFQVAQLSHERFFTLDHYSKIFLWYLQNWTFTKWSKSVKLDFQSPIFRVKKSLNLSILFFIEESTGRPPHLYFLKMGPNSVKVKLVWYQKIFCRSDLGSKSIPFSIYKQRKGVLPYFRFGNPALALLGFLSLSSFSTNFWRNILVLISPVSGSLKVWSCKKSSLHYKAHHLYQK